MSETSLARRLLRNPLSGVVGALLLIFIASSLLSDAFLDAYNLSIIARALAFVGLITLGQAMLMILGELDLSLGMISGLAAVASGMLMVHGGLHPAVAILLALCVGGLCGLVNGLLVTGLGLHSLVLTIGMSGVYLAFKLGFTKGAAITGIPEGIYFLGQASFFGLLPEALQKIIAASPSLQGALEAIPMPAIIMLSCLVIIAFVLAKTPFGRYMYAIGNNPAAAKILGIRVNRVRVIVFVCAGVLSALAGILMVARMGTAQPSIGENWVLPSIAASVIGGVSTTGGVGGPIGAILGAAIVNIIENIIILVGIDTYWQSGVSGAVVVIAISVDALSRRFFRKDG
jgi:ribose transport system permease protein